MDNDGIELAGYLTFLNLLALFPFLVLIVATAGFLGQSEAGASIIALMVEHLPKQALIAIQPRIEEIMAGPPQGLVTLSILGAIWTSSSAVEGMRTVLNRAYQVSNPPTYILRRMMSILQLILFMIVMTVVMSIIVLYPIVLEHIQHLFGAGYIAEFDKLWSQYFIYFGGGMLFLVVASLYYFLPNIRQSLLAVVPGAALVILMWIEGASFFTFYLANVHQVNIIYGSLGGFIATLLFFFIMNIIFIYGAEFNNMLLHALGMKTVEKRHVDVSDDVVLIDRP